MRDGLEAGVGEGLSIPRQVVDTLRQRDRAEVAQRVIQVLAGRVADEIRVGLRPEECGLASAQEADARALLEHPALLAAVEGSLDDADAGLDVRPLAEAVLALVRNRYTTGEVFVVDGGMATLM